MDCTFAKSLSKSALVVALAATLTFPATAPARANNNGDAVAAAAFFGLVAVAIIASSRKTSSAPSSPPTVDPRKLLPAECRFRIRHGSDQGVWFGRRCLVKNFDHWPLLPHRCTREVDRLQRHNVTVYKPQCLAKFGYRADDHGYLVHR